MEIAFFFYLVPICTQVHGFFWLPNLHAKGKTGGQQGDPLDMLIFCLTIHHLRGLVLAKIPGGSGDCVCR